MSLIKRLTFTAQIAADWPSLSRFWSNTFLFSLAIRWSFLYKRFVQDQTAKKYQFAWEGKHLNLMMRAQDLPIFYEIFADHAYDFSTHVNWPAEATVLDLGGHIGLFSSYLLTKYSSKLQITAVEPSPDNFKLLQTNLEPFKSIQAHQKAVALTDGKAFLQTDRLSYNHQISTIAKGLEVTTIALAKLLEVYTETTPLFLLKMDVEGLEAALIPELRAYKSLVKYCLVELHPPYNLERLLADLFINEQQVIHLDKNTYLVQLK
ncbi:MAG: FkbM family methyltransferase [Bacteroidota bacterium]